MKGSCGDACGPRCPSLAQAGEGGQASVSGSFVFPLGQESDRVSWPLCLRERLGFFFLTVSLPPCGGQRGRQPWVSSGSRVGLGPPAPKGQPPAWDPWQAGQGQVTPGAGRGSVCGGTCPVSVTYATPGDRAAVAALGLAHCRADCQASRTCPSKPPGLLPQRSNFLAIRKAPLQQFSNGLPRDPRGCKEAPWAPREGGTRGPLRSVGRTDLPLEKELLGTR